MLPGKCTDVTRLLSDALDRRLTLHERLQVRVHLPTCSGCRAYRGQLALLRTVAKAAAGREPDGDDGSSGGGLGVAVPADASFRWWLAGAAGRARRRGLPLRVPGWSALMQ